jgi:hypothetical protein
MITRLLKLLRARSLELGRYSERFVNWDNGKTTSGVRHVPEKLEIDALIKELEQLEIMDVNPGKRRKWTHADTWLPAGCVIAMIEDEELAKS